ncbi:hypothetical protein cyc_02961 [Cyclospora cayetanensis]|uniref:Uncharacterized protein n=1 Tax=Cyclospora cayetanensis TaxID=88456 RepID=A0A1D3DAC7_9EIME|nr:hypothetical protein cyc_02961 [Cyclospora cayetanensis]
MLGAFTAADGGGLSNEVAFAAAGAGASVGTGLIELKGVRLSAVPTGDGPPHPLYRDAGSATLDAATVATLGKRSPMNGALIQTTLAVVARAPPENPGAASVVVAIHSEGVESARTLIIDGLSEASDFR